jgi:NADH-quinone oxidoreductase subunit L
MFSSLIIFSPIFLILHCIFIFLFKKWLGPVATFYCSLFVFSLAICSNFYELYNIAINGNYFYFDFGRFFFCLDLIDSHLIFCVDTLALLCSLLVLILTALALYFGIEYMFRDAFINRLLYLLNLFATSVISLFFCYDFFLIIFAWECIGLFSLLLVNFYSMRIYTIKAALKTFIFSRISDMFMFVSFILSIVVFNTTDLSLIFLQIPFLNFHYIFINQTAIHFLTCFALMLVLSGTIKAAQFFSHVWLPDAMEAPTPASALIHSSTLVVAGVFLIIRFSVLFEFTPLINLFLALLGGTTLAFGAVTATFQHDIKKLVAYSTISQIGYLVCGCGFACYEEVLIYLIIHALNKAFLFILVGYIVHFFNGNTDLRQMGGAYLYSFDILVFIFSVGINLSGLPYSAGFFGKEFLLLQMFKNDAYSLVIRCCWFVGFFFTPIYMLILTFVVFFGPKKGVLSTFLNVWNFQYLLTLLNLVNTKNFKNASGFLLQTFRFQYSIFTSRTTVYVLFLFWLFFYFLGEFYLLTIFNYVTLTDTINSHFFFLIKNHNIFDLFSNSTFLNAALMFFIIFFTCHALFFLLSLRYSLWYNYMFNTTLFDGILLLIILFTFNYWFLLVSFFFFWKK